MKKKWLLLFIILLLIMSYSIFEISKIKMQIDFVQKITRPYDTYEDFSRRISLLGADDIELVKKDLMEVSDKTQVNFTISFSENIEDKEVEYYWYLQDNKYLSSNMGLNKSLDIGGFNALEDPITNNVGDEYHFKIPIDSYSYKIYPFHLYDKSNLSVELIIFGDSEEKTDAFINGLEEKGIIYKEYDLIDYQNSFLQTIAFTIFQNPLTPLTFGLFLIAIFAALYQDRRNLSIKLVNGYSKTRYILEKMKKLLWLETIAFMVGFLALYIFFFYFDFEYFFSILTYFLPIALLVNLLSLVLLAFTVYSFTDIDQTSYILGVRPRSFAFYMVGASKFFIGLLICLSLIPTISDILHTGTIYKSMSKQMDKYSNTYIMDGKGNYITTIMEKSDEIVEALEDFENIIYQSHFDSGREHSGKLVRVNHNYLKMHPILDENSNPIDPNRSNVVYTKEAHLESVEELKPFPGYLCSSEDNCMDVETIIVHEDAELKMYNVDVYADNEEVSKEFILVPQNEKFYILQLFFIFENNEQIQEVLGELKDIVDIDSVGFRKITDGWAYEIDIYKDIIIRNSITLMNYLILMVILSLIYYQIKFDRVRKNFSIYWVNGVSKFNYFYIDYIYQIILNAIMIILVKTIFYPDISIAFISIIFFIFIGIDTMSLAIFRHQFYRQLQKNIKEQM